MKMMLTSVSMSQQTKAVRRLTYAVTGAALLMCGMSAHAANTACADDLEALTAQVEQAQVDYAQGKLPDFKAAGQLITAFIAAGQADCPARAQPDLIVIKDMNDLALQYEEGTENPKSAVQANADENDEYAEDMYDDIDDITKSMYSQKLIQ